MDFSRGMVNWRNAELKAHAPTFIKRKATGEGSFRAASAEVAHDQVRLANAASRFQ